MKTNAMILCLCMALAVGCSTKTGAGGGEGNEGGVAVIPDIPAGAQNPLVIGVEGTTVAQLTDAAETVVGDEGLNMIQADPKEGIVETRMIDLGSIRGYGPDVMDMEPEQRQVFYVFAAGKDPKGTMVTEILGYYKPDPEKARSNPDYRELLPTKHPGFAYQVRLQLLLKNELEKRQIAIIESGAQ